MKTFSYVPVIVFAISGLSGCTSYDNIHQSDIGLASPKENVTQLARLDKYTPTSPLLISFYPKGDRPHLPYKVIGKETVSKYNLAGVKRQQALIREAMSQLAASVGGDAVIDISHDKNSVSGTIITYKKIRV